MPKQLLTEFFELCPDGICQDLLTEREKREVANGAVYLTGRIQAADTPNGNGRVYPKKVLQKEIANYEKIVKDNRATGELDHPDDSVINLKNVSHMVIDVWWQKSDVMGKIKVLDTPSGRTVKDLINAGVKLGISSRGMGSVSEGNGQTMVEDDFQLICFDFVSEPSTPGAFMMSEAKDLKESNIFTKADKINRLLKNILGDYDNE